MDLNKICYFLITGASKGIGRTMAIECSKKLKKGSVVVLLARSGDHLTSTKEEILQSNKDIDVKIYPIDLAISSKNELLAIIEKSLEGHTVKDFELAFIIHNAGSPGDSSKYAKDLDDSLVWTNYYQLNVFSVAILNSVFMKKFQSIKKFVVNITSKCGLVPFKSLTLYGSGKAAREMYFRVLAEEEQDTLVLNYSPGPVETEMTHNIHDNSNDKDIRNYFHEQFQSKTILTTAQTTEKFLSVVHEMKFKSGDHVDYFD